MNKSPPENNAHPHETFSGGIFHNQALKNILELNLFVGCGGVEDSRNIVGLKLWADENVSGKMYYIKYIAAKDEDLHRNRTGMIEGRLYDN